jgi:hypothetical protein
MTFWLRSIDKEKAALFILFSILTFLQVWVARAVQYVPQYDAGSLFAGAVGLATTGKIPNPEYFAMFGNQWGLLIFISAFLWIGQLFTQNFFMVYACVLVILVNTGLYALYDLTRAKLSRRVAFIILGIVLLYPQIYVFPSKIYTDAASMAMPIVALNLYYRMGAEETRKKRVVLAVLMGITIALGAAFKPTVAIVYIAMLMLSWMFAERARIYKCLLISGAVLAVLVMALRIGYNASISDDLLERWQTPWYQWVVMGLKGEGLELELWSSTRVEHFYGVTYHMETLEEREAFIRSEFIRLVGINESPGDWARLFGKKFVVLHYRGDFSPGCTITFSPDDTGFKAWFRDIRLSAPYFLYHRVILYSVFLLAYISVFFKKRDWVASLALFGVYVFFIFLSEVRSRQLTNYLFVFFYLAAVSIDGILRKVDLVVYKRNKKQLLGSDPYF